MALNGDTYWLTFRIADDGHFAAQHRKIVAAVASAAEGRVWDEPAAFCLFRSKLSIDALADHIATALRLDRDFALIGMPHHKAARVLGHWKDDRVRSLIPFAQLA